MYVYLLLFAIYCFKLQCIKRTFRKEMSTMKTCILIYNKMYGVHPIMLLNFIDKNKNLILIGPRQANLVLIAYASSEGSGEPAHPRSLARTCTARSYKQ